MRPQEELEEGKIYRYVKPPNRWLKRSPTDLRAAREQKNSFLREIDNDPLSPSSPSSEDAIHILLAADAEPRPRLDPEHSSQHQTGSLDELSVSFLSLSIRESDKTPCRLSTSPAEKRSDSGLPVHESTLVDTDHTEKSTTPFGGSRIANATPSDDIHNLPQEEVINNHQRPVNHIEEQENEVPARVLPPGFLSSLREIFPKKLLDLLRFRVVSSRYNACTIDGHDHVSSNAYAKDPSQEFQVTTTASRSDAYSKRPSQEFQVATSACFDAPPVSANLSRVNGGVPETSNSVPSHPSSSRPVASSLELCEPEESPPNITSAPTHSIPRTDLNPPGAPAPVSNKFIFVQWVPPGQSSLRQEVCSLQVVPSSGELRPNTNDPPVSESQPLPDLSSSGRRKTGTSSSSVKKRGKTARIASRVPPPSTPPPVVQTPNPRLWSPGGSSYSLPALVENGSLSPVTGMELIEEEVYAEFLERDKPFGNPKGKTKA